MLRHRNPFCRRQGYIQRMITTTTEPSSILSGLRQAENGLPAWLREQQISAWADFESQPLPARTDELWRFSAVKNLTLDEYTVAAEYSGSTSEIVSARGFSEPSGRIVFANERVVQAEFFDPTLEARGVLFLTLEEALAKHSELLREHFMAQPARLGAKKFAALHKALVRSGGFLYVPRGIQIELPFEVFHIVEGDRAAVFPHTLIIAEESSRVTFLDHFVSADATHSGFACGVNDLVLKPGAALTYVSVQDWSRSFVSVQVNSTVADKDASAVNLSMNFGGRYSRLESVSRMIGTGARSDMLAVSVASDDQEFDQRTLQDHLKPDTTSDLLYKNSLNNRARTIFSGLIKVERGAHRTDAYQKVRNLLLSDEAEANSLPGLEILADDVRCTHGATSGQVEPEELFYLMSRGIPENAAKGLIVRGFLNEVVNRLPGQKLTGYLHQQIDAHL